MRILIFLIILVSLSCTGQVNIHGEISVGEEVEFLAEDGTRLTGSLIRPAVNDPVPAIVILVGSGNFSYRTYWLEGSFGIWKLIAESFVDQGFAVFMLEKRGINKSEGNWKRSTLFDRSSDARSAIEYLHSRDDIDSSTIGLCGHSQGGWVAQITAADNPELVDFIITLAGPAVSVKEQVLQDHRAEWICEGLDEQTVSNKVRKKKSSLGRFQSFSGLVKVNHLSRIIDYDPEQVIRRIQCPWLAVFAENDQLVPPDPNIEKLNNGMKARPEIVLIDSSNHFFISSDFCTSWSELEPAFAPDFDSLIRDWQFLKELSQPE